MIAPDTQSNGREQAMWRNQGCPVSYQQTRMSKAHRDDARQMKKKNFSAQLEQTSRPATFKGATVPTQFS